VGKNKKSTEYGLIFLFAVAWYAYIHTNKGVTMKTAERLRRRMAVLMEALSGMEGMVRGSLIVRGSRLFWCFFLRPPSSSSRLFSDSPFCQGF
jgi:hypothetical protein